MTTESVSENFFENQLIFGEVMDKSLVSCFFSDSQCSFLCTVEVLRFLAALFCYCICCYYLSVDKVFLLPSPFLVGVLFLPPFVSL